MFEARARQSGFTMVELSIVLVVIAFLIGGVMVGQNLVQRAKLMSLINQMGQYKTAYLKFQDIYKALPGDMIDATEQWGTDTGTGCGTPVAGDRVPKTATCNGDGNGYIGYLIPCCSTNWNETFRFWQHLSNAGLIKGTFTGVAGAGGAFQTVTGENSPKGPFNGGFSVYSMGTYAGDTYNFPGNYGATLIFGRDTGSTQPVNPILTPRQAYNIDLKMDDGLPATGAILSFKQGGPFWSNCAAVGNGAYALTSTAIACGTTYIMEFKN